MVEDFTVVDMDAHYLEAMEDIARYMDTPWRTRLLEGGKNAKNYFFPSGSGSRFRWGKLDREAVTYPDEPMTPEQIPAAMEFLGVDKTVIISHMMLLSSNVEADDDRTAAFATGYVNYMAENVVDPAQGIFTLIPIPFQDPAASVDLIEEWGGTDGFVGACFITPGAEPPLGNRKYEPIYEAAEAAGLPVIFHTGGAGIDGYHTKGYEKFIETHTLGFLESNLSQLTSLVIQGVPEKFPDLDIVFMESGVFWIPALMYRLDEEYLKRAEEAPLLRKKPSEYMKTFYYGTQPLEKSVDPRYLENTIEMIGGPDRLMYASDYPHWDFDRPTAITDRPFLSEEEKAKILGGTAEEVLGL